MHFILFGNLVTVKHHVLLYKIFFMLREELHAPLSVQMKEDISVIPFSILWHTVNKYLSVQMKEDISIMPFSVLWHTVNK